MFNKLKICSLIVVAIVIFSNFDTLIFQFSSNPSDKEDFVNFETAHVHPLDLTPDGSKLLAVNIANYSLEVFDVQANNLVQTASISVGVDPVSVRALNDSIAWVVNQISDNISIVNLNTNVVENTLEVGNEPGDVVFAGNPLKAFVSCGEPSKVYIFEINNLSTAPVIQDVIGEDLRAMAVSPDGNTVYAAFFESSNQTTALEGDLGSGITGSVPNLTVEAPIIPPNNGSVFNPPIGPAGFPTLLTRPPLPVRKNNATGEWLDDNGTDWSNIISGGAGNRVVGWDMLDRDVVVLNANDNSFTYQNHLGNILMAMDVHPITGKVFVVGTDATNEIRYEPVLNGKFLRVNVASFNQNQPTEIDDLNPHLDYQNSSVAMSERLKSIGDPRGIAWRADGSKAYITGMGSNNVITINANGNKINPIPITVGEGPTGIKISESLNRAFVLNKFDASISIIDLTSDSEINSIPFFDPTPTVIKVGRKHLYNTHTGSGTGHISCASCHVDGKNDRLGWDLGNPAGEIEQMSSITQVLDFGAEANPSTFHPMKGLMVTQSFQDVIKQNQLLHWRGDRDNLGEFAGAFVHLQGADAEPSAGDMQEFEDFLAEIYFPPNPNRNMDNSFNTNMELPRPEGEAPRFANANAGRQTFVTFIQGTNQCIRCHSPNTGRGTGETLSQTPQARVPQGFRGNLDMAGYWKNYPTASTSGFGFFSNGAMDSEHNFFAPSGFGDDFAAFAYSAEGSDWGADPAFTVQASQDSHAAVGKQVTINNTTLSGTSTALNNLKTIVDNDARIALIANGVYNNEIRHFYYLGSDNYQSDRQAQQVTQTDLLNSTLTHNSITWTVVHDNIKVNRSVDRNNNDIFDKDEELAALFTFTLDTLSDLPVQVDFDGSLSYNPHPGDNLIYVWDFSNGSSDEGVTVTNNYTVEGMYEVTLTVIDTLFMDTAFITQTISIQDICPNLDNTLIGTSCDDGSTCTMADTWQTDCICAGTPILDSDNDGICDAEDTCPNFDNNLIGGICDDGDECTINETYDQNCNCGNGIFYDTDLDGVCDIYDIDDDNDGILDIVEDSCLGISLSDLTFTNPNLFNITSDGYSTSAGSYQSTYSIELLEAPIHMEFKISSGNGAVIGFLPVSGTQTPNNWFDGAFKFYYNGALYQNFANQASYDFANYSSGDLLEIDIDITGTITGKVGGNIVATGSTNATSFNLAITQTPSAGVIGNLLLNETGSLNCQIDIDLDNDNIINSKDSDSDNDGCPDAIEADGNFSYADLTNNALSGNVDSLGLPLLVTIPQQLGSSHDDNVLGQNCCSQNASDADNDGICDLQDQCPNFDNSLIGTACDDGMDCSNNDIWLNDCTCAGTITDSDNDGICDADDVCPFNPINIDSNNDGICDGLTIVINEIITSNNGNETGLYDEDGDSPDYIELYNTTNSTIDISDWKLIDGDDIYKFPLGTTMNSGTYLTVWASGKEKYGSVLHTNFQLNNAGEYLGLYDAQNNLVFEFGSAYPPQNSGLSYGLDANQLVSYFTSITKDAENANAIEGKVAKPYAAKGRGFYLNTVIDTLFCDYPNAEIRYTTDGSTPTSSSLLFSNNIAINPSATGIVVIKAKAFASGSIPSEEVTWSYIYANTLFAGNAQAAQGISSLPVVSINTRDLEEIECINPSNSYQSWDCFEVESSFEWIAYDSLNNPIDVQANSFGQQFGQGSIFYGDEKRNYRFKFNEIAFPFFEGYDYGTYETAEKFKRLEIRGGTLDSYENDNSTFPNSGLYATENWMRSTNLELGNLGQHSRFVNVFINGEFKGVYTARERFDHHHYESYLDESSDDVSSIKIDDVFGFENIANGDNVIWNQIQTNLNYQSVKHLIDVKSIIYRKMIESLWSEHDEKEYRVLSPLAPSKNKRLFIINADVDLTFANTNYMSWNPSTYLPNNNYLPMWYSYINDTEFVQDVLEATAIAFCNDGALTVSESQARMTKWVNEVDLAMHAELDRTNRNSYSYNYNTWQARVTDANNKITQLTNMHTGWANSGLYSGCDLRPVVDTENQISQLNSTVSYFVDATDPDGDAMTFSVISGMPPGLTINATTGEITGTPTQIGTYEVQLKVEDTNNKWGYHYFTWEVLNLNMQAGGNLIINEIHYNPIDSILTNGGKIDDDNFEFVEVKNIGTANVVLLGKVFTKGIDLEIKTPLTIAPDSFAVFAKDSCWFEAKYGFFPDAVYSGKLDNGGEHLRLKGPFKEILDSLTYDDSLPWNPIPDNSEYSLAYILGSNDNNMPTNWAAQSVFVTPRAENEHCPGPISNNFQAVDETCAESNNGYISISAFGGDGGPYNFLWEDGSTSGLRIDLSAGSYIVEISDASNCKRSDTITINSPDPIIVNSIVQNQYSFDEADGSAEVIILSGGNAPFSYSWSDGQISAEAIDLYPGIYMVSITDNNNCSISDTVTVLPVDCSTLTLSLNSTNETAQFVNDGTATVTANGGTPPYFYSWSNGESSSSIYNLSPGFYAISLVDLRGCQIEDSVEILEYDCGLSVSATATDQSYFGINNGSAGINVITGVAPYAFNWSNGETTQTVNNLTPGNYSVQITAADNCMTIENIVIYPVDCNNLFATFTSNGQSCFNTFDGNITTYVSGGNSPFAYSWDSGETTANLTNKIVGNYSLTITDNLGCLFIDTIEIEGPQNPLGLSANITDASTLNASDGAIDLTVNGGTPPFTYFWANSASSEDVNNLLSGNYWVIVSDANNCNITDSYTINVSNTISCDPPINISFVANNNGISIFWDAPISGADSYKLEYRAFGISAWSSISTSSTLFIINALSSCTDYEFRLSSICSGIESTPTVIQTFTTSGCPDPCPTNLIESSNGNLSSGIFQVSDYIESNGILFNGNSLSYKAGSYIDLQTGFEVKLGADFEAVIDGCAP